MQTIKPLSLTTGNEIDDNTQVIRWYGWDLKSGVTWDASPNDCPAGAPDFACDVTVPNLIGMSTDEIRADIAQALRNHSANLGL